MNAAIAILHARIGVARRRGSSLVEVTLALIILMGVAYATCMQDTLSLTQASYDSQHAVATAYIENETARVRASFATNDPASFLTNYPSEMGVTNITANIPLGGTMAIANARCPYLGTLYRSIVSQITANQGLVYNRYEVSLQIPCLRGNELTNEVLTRDVDMIMPIPVAPPRSQLHRAQSR